MAAVVGRHRALEERQLEGLVMLDDDIVGSFELDEDGTITVKLNNRDRTVFEMLDFASSQGMALGFMTKPKYDDPECGFSD